MRDEKKKTERYRESETERERERDAVNISNDTIQQQIEV